MNPRSGRLAALSGVAFVVLFVTGMAMFDLPGHDDLDQALNSFYADAGNRTRVIVGAYLLGGAGLLFLWFAYYLRGRLQIAEREAGGLSGLGFASAVVFVMLLFSVGATQGPTYAASINFYDEPQAELSRIIPHQAYGALAYGFLAAALCVATTSLTIRATGVFPRWLAWVGFVAAVLLLPGLLFVPIFMSAIALLAWVLAVSFALFRERETVNGHA